MTMAMISQDESMMDFVLPVTTSWETRLLYPLLEYNETSYTPPPYVPPQIVNEAHLQPRFGKSNTLDGIIEGDRAQTRDYVTGVVIGSLIIAIVALVWFVAIICLKIAGSKRVGFLAGRFVSPNARKTDNEEDGVEIVLEKAQQLPSLNQENNVVASATDDDENNENRARAMKNFGIRVGIVRCLFVLSGVAVIASGGLFYSKGAISFRNALDEVQYGIDMAQAIGEKAMQLSENVTQAAEDVEDQIQPQDTNSDEQICGLDSAVSSQIRSLYNQLTTNVEDLKSIIDENIDTISSDIESVLSTLEDIENALEWSDIFFTVLIVITVVIIALIVAMLLGAFFAWKGISNSFTKCIQYALIWPLLIFFLILSWIFATLFLAAGLAGADFCVSPDKYVEAFLYANEEKFDGILLGFLIYYVTGCKVIPPGMKYFAEASTELKAVMTATHELTSVLANLPVESILLLCDLTVEEATALKEITTFGHTIMHVLDKTLIGLREVISCETMNPLYTTFVHEALCKQAVAGMSWIFYTTLFIAIFSMVLIMTRAALYPIRYDGQDMNDKAEIEVVKYTEHPVEKENIIMDTMNDDINEDVPPPFENVPESVYDRVTNNVEPTDDAHPKDM